MRSRVASLRRDPLHERGGDIADRQASRRTATEARIVAAATQLFVEQGYARTTLAQVADAADVAHRTIYVRFETKARLFQRVVEVAIVGDTDAAPLPDREWSIRSMTAPTLDERIDAFADGVADMNARLGPLMAVNGEVEPSEPAVQESAGVWRDATLEFLRAFWRSAAASGLLRDDADVDWLVDTSALLSAAETRLLATRTLAWERDAYRDWLATSWRRIAAAGSPT